jgi:hypothetical protein
MLGVAVLGARIMGQVQEVADYQWPGLLANLLMVQAWGLTPDTGQWNFPA